MRSSIIEKKCDVCGCVFETRSRHARFCPSCRRRVNSARGALKWKGMPSAIEDCVRHARAKLAERADVPNGGTVVHCKFCGTLTAHKSGFCSYCTHAGYDDVYAVTGKSNGWEHGAGSKPHVEAGWRGSRRWASSPRPFGMASSAACSAGDFQLTINER